MNSTSVLGEKVGTAVKLILSPEQYVRVYYADGPREPYTLKTFVSSWVALAPSPMEPSTCLELQRNTLTFLLSQDPQYSDVHSNMLLSSDPERLKELLKKQDDTMDAGVCFNDGQKAILKATDSARTQWRPYDHGAQRVAPGRGAAAAAQAGVRPGNRRRVAEMGEAVDFASEIARRAEDRFSLHTRTRTALSKAGVHELKAALQLEPYRAKIRYVFF